MNKNIRVDDCEELVDLKVIKEAEEYNSKHPRLYTTEEVLKEIEAE